MSNFQFLATKAQALFVNAKRAEDNIHIDPRISCFYSRLILEKTVTLMYKLDKKLVQPYDTNLNALIKDYSFKTVVPVHIQQSVKIIHVNGNKAAHESRALASATSLLVVGELHKFMFWMYRNYFDGGLVGSSFDVSLISVSNEPSVQTTKAEIAGLESKHQEELQKAREEAELEAKKLKEFAEDELSHSKSEIERLKQELAEVQANIAAATQTPDTHDYSEAETRTAFIDVLLSEVDWHKGGAGFSEEYELDGVERNASRTGTGFADYVLFGDDGLPLAVIEAKRTTVEAEQGRLQALDYANALEKKYGQRPIIFYTNGYQHYIWDDLFYNPRQIQGFYKKEELQRLVNRRTSRKDISDAVVDKDIAGRSYQKLAIKSVCEHFDKGNREALLVMATGTGKTRTTIALVKLLQENSWAKRVLFLCDRISLLTQAKKAFLTNLPDSPAVDLRSEKDNTTARISMCTYGTMMGLIDKTHDGKRLFSVGHYDLVVIDEAHRSVYQKYKAIFEYYDSLLVGLTATPRSEVDKNTFALFDIEDGVPMYNYDLGEAVANKYLVPFSVLKVSSSMTRDGLKYNELSAEEKGEYEKEFTDEETGELPAEIGKESINKWLFNTKTVDGFLANLMEYGIKVDGGDKLGKTIIFAKNQDHAKFIVERFEKNYKHLKGHFCTRIDYSLGKDAQTMIDKFSIKDGNPQIAVSVDMLDTGIDVPEVVNLVFAKPVYSKTKFWQMIGRGTRLCENLFAHGEDKKEFLIFDYCSNFEFFEENAEGREGRAVEGLSQMIFETNIKLCEKLSRTDDEAESKIRKGMLAYLHQYVSAMNQDNFLVRPHLEYVEKYAERKTWDTLNDSKVSEVLTHVSKLPSEMELDDEDSKRWDLLLLRTELALLNGDKSGYEKLVRKIRTTALLLEDKVTIPDVKKHIVLIQAIGESAFWECINLTVLEEVREKLRGLVKYIESKKKKIVHTSFEDSVDEVISINPNLGSVNDLPQYRKKMQAILDANKMNPSLQKIRHNLTINKHDVEELEKILFEGDLSQKKDFEAVFGGRVKDRLEKDEVSLGLLIRSIIGLDREDVEKAFADFIDKSKAGSKQLEFVKQVINFLVRDGFVPAHALYEPPFTDIYSEGPDGLFVEDRVDELFGLVEGFNEVG